MEPPFKMQSPAKIRNHQDPAIFAACTLCGGYAWFRPNTYDMKSLASNGCYPNGHVLTVNLSEAPQTQGPAAATCSPDRSAYAYWVQTKGWAMTIPPTRTLAQLATPPSPADNFPELEKKRQQLLKLKDYEKFTENDFDDQLLKDAWLAILDRERRKVQKPEDDED